MLGPSWLLAVLAVAGIAGGATAALLVLSTSGPSADLTGNPDQSSLPAAGSPSPSPTLGTTSGSPATRPTANPAQNATKLDVDEPFDPAKLPAVDTSTWVVHIGPRRQLTIRAPESWTVTTQEHFEYTGTTVIGDSAKVLKVANLPTAPVGFLPKPGDVWADIATEPAYVAYSVGSNDQQMFHQVRFAALISGHNADVLATQFKRPAGFEPGVGALTFFVSVQGPGGEYLVAAVHVALPADLTTIAEAQALLTTIVLK